MQPPLWYLRGEDGELKPAIGWTPEELEELAQIKLGLKQRDQLPRFNLQWMSAVGGVKGGHAELKIDVKVLVRDDNGVRIPLRLNEAVLREGIQYEGKGQQSLAYEEKGDGYVSFLRGGSGEVHRLTLNVLVPLSQVGNETRLKLSMPRTTSWEMKLKVPVAKAVAAVSEGATLLPPSSTPEGETEFAVLGNGSDLELSWRKQEDAAAETPTVLEAVGEVLARADGRSIDLEAKITVRGYGAPWDRFRIRLPKGAELTPASTAGYSLVPVPAEASAAESGRLVEVQLPKKASAAEEIRLAARIAYEAGTSAAPVELSGFEVLGAARQWGHIAVSAVGDWHVRFEADPHVRQVDTLPEWLRSEGLVAGFEYFRQPYSLVARVVPRETRTSVEPEYLVLVEANQVRLEAKLKYTVRGAKAFRLNLELPQWQLEEVGPDNLVNADGVGMDKKTGLLTVPLAQPSVGQMEVAVRASIPIAAGQSSLLVELPRPQAGSVGPAAVVVLPADNVELTPNAESTLGLLRQQVAPEIRRPQWQQSPLFYRVEGSKAVFAADFRVRSQEISAAVSSRIIVDRQQAQVEQSLAYTISYEPADRLTLEMAPALAASGRLQVFLKDQPLTLADTAPQSDAENRVPRVRKDVKLPPGCIGPCELTVRYKADVPKPSPDAGAIAHIPLVMPADGKISANTLWVTAAGGIRFQHREGPWRLWENGGMQASRGEGLRLSAADRADEVVLAMQFEDAGRSGSTVVNRAWVETWLVGGSRQDRAVFRFTSTQKTLEMLFPAGVHPLDVEVLLDGKPVSHRWTPDGKLLVGLSPRSDSEPRQLEVLYHFRDPRPGPGGLSVELPRLGQDVWVRRMYWQILLPGNEHLIVAPAGFTPEYRWTLDGGLFRREPVLDQAALEAWSGAQPAAPLPAGANRYLFSSLGQEARCKIRTTTRSLMVLTASGVALVVGLLLLYVPATRHPWALLSIALTLAGAALVYPGPALLAAQAASLGVVLTLLAGLLQRSMGRKRRPLAALDRGSSMLFEKESTQVQHRAMPAGDHLSTESAPAPVHAQVSDSHA